VEEFDPITRIGESPNIVAVTPSLPAKDLRELIALAKAKPGELNYGATSSPTHLATELLASRAGIKLTRVPYKGAAPAMQALMAGDVQIVLSGIGTMLPQAKAGRIRAIAVTGAQRSPLAPEIPTVEESGIQYVATTWYGLLAPAGTPRPVIDRLNHAAHTSLEDPATKAQLAPQGVVLRLSTPEEFGAFLRSEVGTWAKVVQDSGARVE
jgi:tripartite-type tricarboxylate transporter receptor subunit TctC